MAFQWVNTNNRAPIPHNAVEGGRDKDGSIIYVGQTSYEGDELPVKVVPNRGTAYVTHNGKEVAISNFKVLVGHNFRWVPSSGGHIPPKAVPGGRTKNGETLYIGRAHHEGALVVGKVHPSHGTCYIGFKKDEHGYKNYEILVHH